MFLQRIHILSLYVFVFFFKPDCVLTQQNNCRRAASRKRTSNLAGRYRTLLELIKMSRRCESSQGACVHALLQHQSTRLVTPFFLARHTEQEEFCSSAATVTSAGPQTRHTNVCFHSTWCERAKKRVRRQSVTRHVVDVADTDRSSDHPGAQPEGFLTVGHHVHHP